MKKKLKDALHSFKIEAFKMSHLGALEQQDVADEIKKHASESLDNEYHFQFEEGQDTSPHHVETVQLIKSVTINTILPPVLEKLMRRITVLEHTNKSMIKLLDELMEALSEE